MRAAAARTIIDQVEMHPGFALRRVACEAQANLTTAPGRGDAFRHRLRKGAENRMANAKTGKAARGERCRMQRVHERAFWREDVEYAEETTIGLNLRIKETFDRRETLRTCVMKVR